MKKILSLILVIGMLCAMMVSVNATTAGGTLTLEVSPATVKVGETFTVTVKYNANEGYAFRGASIKVEPVTANYKLTAVAADDDFTAAINNTTATIGEDTTTGELKGTFVQTYTVKSLAAMNTIPQSGTFCTFTFEALAEGEVDIDLVGTASNLAYFKSRTSMKATDEKKLDTSSEVAAASVKIETNAPAVPEVPAYAVESENYDDIVVGDVTYTNVYVGEYSATPVAGVGISKIGIKTPAGVEIASKNVTIEGGAKVTFKAAILGVSETFAPEKAPVVFSEYAFAD